MSENQQTFFGEAGALEALSQAGDPMETLSGCIDFEAFRAALEKAFIQGESKGPGGRPRWDAVVIFKALVLQRIYNLSDEQMEYQSRTGSRFTVSSGWAWVSACPTAGRCGRTARSWCRPARRSACFKTSTNGCLRRG